MSLSACEGIVPALQSMLSTPPDAASPQLATFPVFSTPAGMLSFPTQGTPASIGTELTFGSLAITVQQVMRPADVTVGNASKYTVLEAGEEYLMVKIRVRCDSTDKCRAVEFDFGVSGDSGRDYTAEFSTSFSGLHDLFEGGDIAPGKSLGGYLVFIVNKDDTGLTLVYPRMYNFGGAARFTLGP